MRRIFVRLLGALLLCSTAFAQNMATPLLEKAANFYQKFEKNNLDRLKIFEKDELSNLGAEDLEFFKSRVKVYGLAPFTVKGSSLIVSLGSEKSLEIDYQAIDASTLIIQGIPYTFNLHQPLKKLYEVDYKKALRKFRNESSSLWHYPFFTLALSGCVNPGTALESATNSSSVPMAYLRVCAECANIAINPTGALIGSGLAAGKGAYAGIKEKSWKACGMEFCKNLPGLGAFMNLYQAKKNHKQDEFQHSK